MLEQSSIIFVVISIYTNTNAIVNIIQEVRTGKQ